MSARPNQKKIHCLLEKLPSLCLKLLGQDFRRLIWAVEKTEEEKGIPQPEDIPSKMVIPKGHLPNLSSHLCPRSPV